MLNKSLDELFVRWTYRIRPSGAKASQFKNFIRPQLEEAEDRIAPANLIAPVVTNPTLVAPLTRITTPFIGDFSSPVVAVNPTNTDQQVMVATQRGTGINNPTTLNVVALFSEDAGVSWSSVPGFGVKLPDPTAAWDASTTFSDATSPSVTIGRDGVFYIAYLQHTADRSAGALIVESYGLSSNPAPRPDGVGSTQTVLYRWQNGQDPAMTPTVSVDTNVPSLTDGTFTQTDTMVDPDSGKPKAVVVAWSTRAAAPSGGDNVLGGSSAVPTGQFNQYAIFASFSMDAGQYFSSPLPVNGTSVTGFPGRLIGSLAGHFTQPSTAGGAPVIAWSPGTGTTTGGLLTIAWSGASNTSGAASIQTDITSLDAGNLTQTAGFTRSFAYNTAVGKNTITDAIADPNGTNDTAQSTDFAITVPDLSSSGFTTLSDLTVSVAMVHPFLNHVRLELVTPTGNTITLVRNRTDSAGTDSTAVPTPGFSPPPAQNTTAPFQPRLGLGVSNNKVLSTTFSDYGARRINDPVSTFPYIGTYRPESWSYSFTGTRSGALSIETGDTAAEIASGPWILRVTDVRNDRPGAGTGQTTQFLSSFKLNFTSGVNPGFGTDNKVAGAVTVPAGVDFFTNPVNNLPVSTDANGIAPGLSIAYDTSIQPLNNNQGSFTNPAGQLYIAYTRPNINTTTGVVTDTNINVSRATVSANGTPTWSAAVRVNDDAATDNFSEGNRPQFQPTLAVDPNTGTVAVMWYDVRNDANLTRVSTYFATSIDGGVTFTPSPDGGANETAQVYLNTPKTATNGVTYAVDGTANKTDSLVTIEPIPTNTPAVGGMGLGLRQSIIPIAPGKFATYWTGNQSVNNASGGSSVYRNAVTTPAGPRVTGGSSGPVANNVLNSIVVTFDRPIESSSFTADDIVIQYRSALNAISAAPVVLVPGVDYGDPVPLNDSFPARGAASRFRIDLLNPQTGIGTYSYTIGSDIEDTIRRLDYSAPQYVNGTPLAQLVLPIPPAGPGPGGLAINPGTSNTTPPFNPLIFTTTTAYILTVPPQTGPFQFDGSITVSYNITAVTPSVVTLTSPDGTVINLPAVAGTTTRTTLAFQGVPIAGNWVLRITNATLSTGRLNAYTLDVTPARKVYPVIGGNLMDQNVSGTTNDSLASGDPDVFAMPAPDPKNANRLPFTFPYDPLTLPLIITGPKLVSSSMPGQPITADNLVLNGAASSIDLTFDRAMAPATFEADGRDIMRITGPVGVIFDKLEWDTNFPGKPYPVSVQSLTPTSFRVSFPTQVLSGQYNIELGSNIAAASGPTTDFIDTNQNAGLDILRGSGDPITGTFISTTYNSSAGTVAILPGQSVSMPLDIQDLFTITQNLANRIKLSINVTYPNDPDLSADLIAPDGTTVRLFSKVGGNGPGPFANFSNTQFNDGGVTAIQSGTAPFSSGPYTSQFPLSTLSGTPSRKLDGNGVSIPWQLRITNSGSLTGTINRFSLTLPHVLAGTGMGEPVADRFVVGFRIFNQDATNPLTKQVWTPVGPAPTNSQANSSRFGGLAVDPSDPSGNTVYAGGASGGIWKTSDFLTQDSVGPKWQPLTDFGAAYGLNTASIAVFGRNNDPNQSIVFVLTGEGDTGTPGVGVLRSMDGGKSWVILDSTTNVDATGKILPIDSNLRDRTFFGSTGFKIVVDPTPTPTGDLIVYMATSGNNGGVWRSIDTGKHWTLIRAGNADDLVLAAGSRSTSNISSGALEFLYATFAFDGIYTTSQATSAVTMQPTSTQQGNQLIRDSSVSPSAEVLVNAPTDTPNGLKGRIVLAGPAATGDVVLDTAYQGWLYALVSKPDGTQDGFYQTKDFGRNWTKIHLPLFNPAPGVGFPTNNETRPDIDLFNAGIAGEGGQGNYNIAITVDPNNPQIVYLAGLGAGNGSQPQPAGGLIRVDLSKVNDSQSLVFFDNSSASPGVNAGGTNQGVTAGGAVGRPGGAGGLPGFGNVTNLIRDPSNPFTADATVLTKNVSRFTNTGENASYSPFSDFTTTADVHRMIAIKDPLSGKTRLIVGGDHQIATGVDDGTGELLFNIGTAIAVTGQRNGNLQMTQLYSGAVQPSQLAVDISQAVFYGMAQDNGFPVSGPDALSGGDLNWTGVRGDGSQVVTDQTGSGTAYQFRWPCCQNDGVDATGFFRVIEPGTGPSGVSRTNGLLQAGDDPAANVGQWPLIYNFGYFAVNPIDPNGIVSVSFTGRIFRTTNKGLNWQPIGEPTNLPGDVQPLYSRAVAFGAPDPANPGLLNNFIYAGNTAGQVFVTFTGGAPWTNISNGIAGHGEIMQIVPDPNRGSRAAYAVTTGGVFYLPDAKAANPTWIDITGTGSNNLFALRKSIFADVNDKTTNANPLSSLPFALRNLNAIAADWRYAIPQDANNPNSPKFPILYVAGNGGVFRSLDQGQTWKPFPEASVLVDPATGNPLLDPATGQPQMVAAGGFLPNGDILDLDLALGNIDPLTGFPQQSSGGFNMLVASTYGRGSFAIRLDNPLPQYNVLFQSGPRVVGLAANTTSSVRVSFSAPVDPKTVSISDFVVKDATGNIIPIASITPIVNAGGGATDQRNLFEITFATPQPAGTYSIVIGPRIYDFAGFGMNQDQNSVNGDLAINTFTGVANDAFVGQFAITPAPQHGNLIIDMPAQARAGDPVTVKVSAIGTDGKVMTNFNGQVTFTSTDGLISIGNGLPNNYQFTSLDAGTHTFTVTFKTANFLSGTTPTFLTVTDTTAATPTTPLAPFTASIVIRGGAATKFAVTNVPASIVAGALSSVTVTAIDQYGNVADGYTDTIRFTSSDPLIAANDGLPQNYTFLASEFGSHTFTNQVQLKTATSDPIKLTPPTQTISVADVLSGLLVGKSSPGTIVLPTNVSSIAVKGYPSPTTAGLAQDFKVVAQDKYNNTASSYTGTVTFTTSDPQVSAGNGLPTDYTFSAADAGFKTFTQGGTLKTAGVQSITATDTKNSALFASQTGIVVVPNAASAFAISGHPNPTVAGTSNGFVVTATDKYGNFASNYTGTVVFASSDPLLAPGNGLPTSYTFTLADGGKHSFPNGATLKTAGLQSISVTDTKTAFTGRQSNIVVLPTVANSFTLTGFPTPTTAGAFQNYVVTARDKYGNVATGYTGTVAFFSSDSQVAAGNGLPINYTFDPADAGVHTFTGALRTAGTQVIAVQDTVNTSFVGQQAGIQVVADVAASFGVSGYPSPTAAGVANTFKVSALDRFGNLSTKYTGTVTFGSSDLQITSNNGLPPTSSFLSSDNGVRVFAATFKTFGNQSLSVTDIANLSVTGKQSNINVTSGNLNKITVSGFPSPVLAGQVSSITVAAADSFGNPVSNYVGTIAFSSTDQQAGLPSNYTFTLGDAGKHTFTTVSLKTAGVQTVTATDINNASLAGSETNISVLPSPAALYILSGFPSTVQALVPFTFNLQAVDPYGNLAVDYNGQATLTSSDPKAIITNPIQFTKGLATSGMTFRGEAAQSLTVTDNSNNALTATQNFTVATAPTGTTPASTAFDLPQVTAVGTDAGIASSVKVLNQDGSVNSQFNPYDASFTGGVRATIARTPAGFNVITAPGPGRFPDIRVIDPATGNTLSSFIPFETSFTGGEFISTADINRDGYDDYVITPDNGGGPRVVVIDGKSGVRMADFFGIEDPNFRGGARTALTDINGDGTPDLVVSAGFGGGPRISVVNGQDVLAGSPSPGRLVSDFFAFEPALRNGAYVAAGDVNGDNLGDIILGAGPGGGPRVRVVNGKQLVAIAQFGGLDEAVAVQPQTQLANFFGGDSNSRGGIRVVARKLDTDNLADLVVGAGTASGSTVTAYTGAIMLSNVSPSALYQFDAFNDFTGGVFVG